MNKNLGLHSFNDLVIALEKLPSIGKKSARKMAFTLGVENIHLGIQVAQKIQECISNTCKCSVCGGLSGNEICNICSDGVRKNGKMCIVGHSRDIFLIEDIGEFSGVYCVIEDYQNYDFAILIDRIKKECTEEIIFAFTPSLSADALMLFIQDKIISMGGEELFLKFSKIAQGVPTNVSLDNIDHFSLAKAFSARVDI